MNRPDLRLVKVSLLLIIALLIQGCSKGFVSQTGLNTATGCSSCGTGTPLPPPKSLPDPWEKVDLNGTVSAGPFGTHKVIDIDKKNNLLLISLPLPANPFGGAMPTIQIPELPGASISLETGTTSAYALVLRVPLSYLVRGVAFWDPAKLPNGMPLPGVAGGELPRLGLKLSSNGNDAYLYLGKGAIAVFVPTPQVNPYLTLTFPIRNQQKRIIGYFATVGATSTAAGGVYLSVVLPPDIQRAIDNIIP